jgi:hypothetical protein
MAMLLARTASESGVSVTTQCNLVIHLFSDKIHKLFKSDCLALADDWVVPTYRNAGACQVPEWCRRLLLLLLLLRSVETCCRSRVQGTMALWEQLHD